MSKTETTAAPAGPKGETWLDHNAAILYSHQARFGVFDGGPSEGTVFLRNWDSSSMESDGHLYRINRRRVSVSRSRSTGTVVFEHAGPLRPDDEEVSDASR